MSHFAGQNGTGYAARAGGRGRARWAGRAEPACGGGSRGLGRGACRGVYWGLRPLAFWGGLSCGLAALYFGTYGARQLFPLETYRPALRAGVGEFGGRGSAAFGATADSGADCKLSGASEAVRLRLAESRKRQFAPPMRTKAFFFGAPHPFLWARPKKWGGTWVLQGPAPAFFTPRR